MAIKTAALVLLACAAAAAAAEPKLYLKIPLADIVRDQRQAYVSHPVADAPMEFALTPILDYSDPKRPYQSYAVKFRQGGQIIARSLSQLEKGRDEKFVSGRYHFIYDNYRITAAPLDKEGPPTVVDVSELQGSLFRSSTKARLGAMDIALIYEDGAIAPAALSILRHDGERITYIEKGQLNAISWVYSVNLIWYGVKLEGPDVAFYSKPSPQYKVLSASPR